MLLDSFFGYGADPVKQLGERPERGRAGRGLRAQPLRGTQQRTGHGGALGLPLRRAGPTGPPRSCRRRVQQPVRRWAAAGCPATTTPAACQLLVRLGLLGLFPVAGQSLYLINAPSFARIPDRPWRTTSSSIDTPGFVEPDAGGPAQYVQSVRSSTANRSTAPG